MRGVESETKEAKKRKKKQRKRRRDIVFPFLWKETEGNIFGGILGIVWKDLKRGFLEFITLRGTLMTREIGRPVCLFRVLFGMVTK